MFHLKSRSMEFLSLGSHYVLDHGDNGQQQQCEVLCFPVAIGFKNFWMLFTDCLWCQSFISISQVHRIIFLFILSCPQAFQFSGQAFGERPYDLSGSTECLRYPASTDSLPQHLLILFPAVQLSLAESVFTLPGNPIPNGLSPSPFKTLPFPLLK